MGRVYRRRTDQPTLSNHCQILCGGRWVLVHCPIARKIECKKQMHSARATPMYVDGVFDQMREGGIGKWYPTEQLESIAQGTSM